MDEKAVILARGLGTRMRHTVRGVTLDAKTHALAEHGKKMMIPVGGAPFLDYSLQNVIHAGFTQICLVIGPRSTRLRRHYAQIAKRLPHLEISFAIQRLPLGTADAVLSAKAFVGSDAFVMLNGDNVYSAHTLRLLRGQQPGGCYCVGFEKDGLLDGGAFDEDRLRQFAVLQLDEERNLVRIQEKPDDLQPDPSGSPVLISMNLFKLTPHIFTACERISPHPVRREYEITSAVQYLVDHHLVPVHVLAVRDGVVDLTYSHDIPRVRAALQNRKLDF